MTKHTSIWTAVLLMTALVMGVILLAVPARQSQAAMLNAQSGFTLLTSGTPGGDEFLVVIDKASEKIIIYNVQGNNINVLAADSFARFFH